MVVFMLMSVSNISAISNNQGLEDNLIKSDMGGPNAYICGGWVGDEINFKNYWGGWYCGTGWGFGEVPVYFTLDFGDGSEPFTYTMLTWDDWFYVRKVDINHTYASAGIYTFTITVNSEYKSSYDSSLCHQKDENLNRPDPPTFRWERVCEDDENPGYYFYDCFAKATDSDGDPVKFKSGRYGTSRYAHSGDWAYIGYEIDLYWITPNCPEDLVAIDVCGAVSDPAESLARLPLILERLQNYPILNQLFQQLLNL